MKKGLSTKEAMYRLQIFGKNDVSIEKRFSALGLFFSQFPTVLNAVLAFAAIFSFIIRDYIDGAFILMILIVNGFFGFIQEYKAEKSMEKLKSFTQSFSRVIRDGREIEISTEEIVPDDLIILSEGERIPADGILQLSQTIEVDESILTGESMPVIKRGGDKVFKGTLVVKGKAHFSVEKTGLNTRFGQIAKTLSKIEEDKTPLQLKLDSLGKILSFIAIGVSLSLIPIGILHGEKPFLLILTAISIGIAAIPESLPAIVTISLAIGTNRMAKRKAIVRKMQAVETLGSVQVILIDKTGTITQNTMRVKKFWIKNKELLSSLFQACVFGNTASLVQKGYHKNDLDIIGDKTDGSLLLFANEKTDGLDKIKNSAKVIDEYSFNPDTKTISTVIEEKGKKLVYVRGAPEEIISRSSANLSEKKHIREGFEKYASQGLRVIAFAKRAITDEEIKKDDLEKNLEFVGFVGISDPPRIEAKQAVLDARKAGVRAIMVTGDNELTALAIASEVGLIEKDEDILTGEKIDKLTDDDLEKIILKTRIFARVKPEDKLRLTVILKKMGYVVGVTGDGVNDALALKKADIGIAMGEKGTDVAKEASDIVLSDDNFSTLVHAIEEGRVIYNNILKSVTYLLSGNMAELSLIFFAVVLGLPSPLLPTQILWINLITDGLPALALASDNKNPNLLKEKPRSPSASILTKNRSYFIIGIGLGLAIFLLGVYIFLLQQTSQIHARTIVFNLLIFLHLLLAFAVRGRSILSVNKFFILTILGTLTLQVIITTVPFFQEIFHLGF